MRRAVASALGPLSGLAPLSRSLTTYHEKQEMNLGAFDVELQYKDMHAQAGRQPDGDIARVRKTYYRLDEMMRRMELHVKSQGFFYLPVLDFQTHKGIMPLFSPGQLRLHYDKHHRAYVNKLNQLIQGTRFYGMSLDEIICVTANDSGNQAIFNNAAQHYNHWFFWKSMWRNGSIIPPDLEEAVTTQYGSVEAFQEKFRAAGLGLFGSGWVYWVYDKRTEQFDILSLPNAGCPVAMDNVVPLLCVDVWEHAYYKDYENDRAKYLSRYFEVVDWHWAERHWKRARNIPYDNMTHE